ncbi:hypothetical protein RHGRI_011465 [Rhododendron griersonianum]|uniref:40S ribosomal protein S6-2 n=1 Tax=Rhododendron griersonianum TaxID=479676 RepID=A0AAV6KN25_9ERIC|nr:hypothetical protein RHGRI_011465 [Rhododendron griersonianum]
MIPTLGIPLSLNDSYTWDSKLFCIQFCPVLHPVRLHSCSSPVLHPAGVVRPAAVWLLRLLSRSVDFAAVACNWLQVEIQRLVTPLTLQRKRAKIAEKKRRIAKAKTEAAEYQKLLASRLKEQREKRSESLAKIRSRLSAASKPSIVA